jgi:hypothetical protein
VQAKLAIRFATQADVSLSGEMPVAGTYNTNEQLFSPTSTVPKETKTISVDVTEKLGAVVSATLTVSKDSLAIERMEWNMLAAMKFDVVAKNIPEMNSTGFIDVTQTIAYKNYDVGMEMVARLNMTTTFEPSLDIYQFPFSTEYPDNIWYTNTSMVTLTGDVSGFINAHGLTTEQKEQIFTEDLKNATGATDFPISFDHLNSPNGEITDGKFGPYYGNTTATRMECVDAVTMAFGDVELEVFEINVGSGDDTIYYSPGFRMFGAVPDASNLPSGVDTAMAFMGQEDMKMEPVTTTKATAEINSIETYTNSIASEAGSNGIADFFFKAPFIGIILIVAVIISVSTVFVILKNARKPLA